jgi:arylsulfatase
MATVAAGRPNVLLIVTDQQRWDTLGCYGNEIVETANLDWLAAEGTVFTSAYSPVPACMPARASLMTGRDPWHTGIVGTGGGNPQCANLTNTLPGVLAGAGYHTQGVGKMHFTPQRSLQGFHHTVLDEEARVRDPGFVSDYAEWFERNKQGDYGRYDHGIDQNSWLARPSHLPEYLHATNWTATESIRFLQRRDPTRPFFLKTSFARPHSPYDPPADYFDRYLHTDLPQPAIGDWVDGENGGRSRDPNAWRGQLGERDLKRARAGYYGSITHIDHQVGRIMRYLRDNKLDGNTVVVVTSDHGDMLGDHHLLRKVRPYEGATHIPMIVRLPARLRGAGADQVSAPVALHDVMPTILDAIGIDIPETVTGSSMVPLIQGSQGAPWREFVHGEYTRHPQAPAMHFLAGAEWKYIWLADADVEQLFHLATDPYETHDLAHEPAHANTLRAWRQRLVSTLEPRQSSLTRDGDLRAQKDFPPVLSPYAVDRIAAPSRNS